MTNPQCIHGKTAVERCRACEADAEAGRNTGFTREVPTSNEQLCREAFGRLIRAASRVQQLGAVTGPQWVELAGALVHARPAFNRLGDETVCAHPVEHLYYHGFVSGNIGDFRCNLCNTVMNRRDLDPRELAARRIESSAVEPTEDPEKDRLRAENNTLREYAEYPDSMEARHWRFHGHPPAVETKDDPIGLMYECRDALALHDQHNELYRRVWQWCQERQQKGSSVEPKSPHTAEEDFQHFLSYSGKRGQNEADLRLAFYAGADVPPPHPGTSIEKALAKSPRRVVKTSGSYTNEASPHRPILPERFNSTSTPEKATAKPFCEVTRGCWLAPGHDGHCD